jgi:EAL domain-containing protein (putative c-di-GMP-specific phosphodiesterase class I)
VHAALLDTGLPACALRLELTETATVVAHTQIDAALTAVRALGVLLALDDFGTGYSSLAHVQRFQPDEVKLDRRFVQGLGRSPRDDTIAGAAVHLAKQLGCTVVAEGIEEHSQREAAVDLGCDHGQGYLIARPQPPEQLARLLARSSSAHPAARTASRV